MGFNFHKIIQKLKIFFILKAVFRRLPHVDISPFVVGVGVLELRSQLVVDVTHILIKEVPTIAL